MILAYQHHPSLLTHAIDDGLSHVVVELVGILVLTAGAIVELEHGGVDRLDGGLAGVGEDAGTGTFQRVQTIDGQHTTVSINDGECCVLGIHASISQQFAQAIVGVAQFAHDVNQLVHGVLDVLGDDLVIGLVDGLGVDGLAVHGQSHRYPFLGLWPLAVIGSQPE